MNKPMTREQAQKIIKAIVYLGYTAGQNDERIEWEKIDYYERYGKALRHGVRKLADRIIKAMAPEPVVITPDDEVSSSRGTYVCKICKSGLSYYFGADKFCCKCGHPIIWQLDTEDTE